MGWYFIQLATFYYTDKVRQFIPIEGTCRNRFPAFVSPKDSGSNSGTQEDTPPWAFKLPSPTKYLRCTTHPHAIPAGLKTTNRYNSELTIIDTFPKRDISPTFSFLIFNFLSQKYPFALTLDPGFSRGFLSNRPCPWSVRLSVVPWSFFKYLRDRY